MKPTELQFISKFERIERETQQVLKDVGDAFRNFQRGDQENCLDILDSMATRTLNISVQAKNLMKEIER